MTATNHALTGAIVGLAIGNPIVALPLAFVSHFICDTIPHFGRDESFTKTKAFAVMLVLDALLCMALVLFLALVRPDYWQLAAVCAFAAASPDFLWIPMYRTLRQGKKYTLKGFYKFASDIQWFQRPIGAVVEFAWLFACLAILAAYL